MMIAVDRGGFAVARVLLAACLLSGAVAAGDSPFVYALNETGRLSLKVTPLEVLPKGTQYRFVDLAAVGSDRYALRVDGRVFRNGKELLRLPFDPEAEPSPLLIGGGAEGFFVLPDLGSASQARDRASWVDMFVGGGSVYALSAGGLVTHDETLIAALPTVDGDFTPPDVPAGTPGLTLPGNTSNTPAGTPGLPFPGGTSADAESFFVDLLDTPFGVFALRLDGTLFDVELGTRVGRLDAGPGVTGAANGTTGDTSWVRLAYDGATGEVLALRADGKLVTVDVFEIPLGPLADGSLVLLGVEAGSLLAMLPATPETIVQRANAYVDLEIAGADDWYVLRRDGAVFGPESSVLPFLAPVGAANFVGAPFGAPFLGPDSTGNPFMDLALYGGTPWRVRSLGQLYAGADLLDALLGVRFVRLAISDTEPDLSDIRNQRPTVAVYKTRVVEGEDIAVPVLALDVDKPTDELVIEVDLSGLPGATYDPATNTVSLAGGIPAGSAFFDVRVDDGGPQKPVRQRLRIKALAADTDPERNRPPTPTRTSKVRALVGVELVLPILATDRDGDPLTITPDGKGVFERGATFDPGTNVLTWTPACLDVGRREAVFRISDGQATRKLRVKIAVVFPLFWDDEI